MLHHRVIAVEKCHNPLEVVIRLVGLIFYEDPLDSILLLALARREGEVTIEYLCNELQLAKDIDKHQMKRARTSLQRLCRHGLIKLPERITSRFSSKLKASFDAKDFRARVSTRVREMAANVKTYEDKIMKSHDPSNPVEFMCPACGSRWRRSDLSSIIKLMTSEQSSDFLCLRTSCRRPLVKAQKEEHSEEMRRNRQIKLAVEMLRLLCDHLCHLSHDELLDLVKSIRGSYRSALDLGVANTGGDGDEETSASDDEKNQALDAPGDWKSRPMFPRRRWEPKRKTRTADGEELRDIRPEWFKDVDRHAEQVLLSRDLKPEDKRGPHDSMSVMEILGIM
eukprot:gnl/Dysnectes_brevis/5165_a7307_801.p1 GENE.gnl/Dysnectes_brevis/5165_a7307_801~~gnl/Dysnectes_brevis/5165_a7307_801.p1  ORF type:complete len:338 (-),score=69.03 gnl/Dysnectes_brevis/5165_a7307_801:59-1072(-)